MAVDRATRMVRMLVANDDGAVDTWEGTGRLGVPKPDGSYMTEDEVAGWFDAAVGPRIVLRLCNHEDSCGLPNPSDMEVADGLIQPIAGAPPLDLYDSTTMQRQFLVFEDGHVHRLERGEWTAALIAASPAERLLDGLDHLGRPINPRVTG